MLYVESLVEVGIVVLEVYDLVFEYIVEKKREKILVDNVWLFLNLCCLNFDSYCRGF